MDEPNEVESSAMSVQDEVGKLVELVYNAALEPSEWNEVLIRVGALVNAPQGNLLMHSSDVSLVTDYGYGRNDDAIELYNTQFIGEDPWNEPAFRLGAGRVFTGQEMLPTSTFENTEYCQECLFPAGIYDCLDVLLELGPGLNTIVGFYRPKSMSVFGEREKKVLRTFVPHMRHAVQIQRRFAGDSLVSMLQTEALDRLNFGVIVLARHGIRYANLVAENILAANDGLNLRRDRLHASGKGDNGKLAAAQERALASSLTQTIEAVNPSLTVQRSSGRRPYVLQIVPMPLRFQERVQSLGSREPLALVVIQDPSIQRPPMQSLMVQAFGLTAAETDLAVKLGAGLTLKDSAEQLGISEQTARWHMKNILSKTEVSRQTELIRLLSRMTSPLARPS